MAILCLLSGIKSQANHGLCEVTLDLSGPVTCVFGIWGLVQNTRNDIP